MEQSLPQPLRTTETAHSTSRLPFAPLPGTVIIDQQDPALEFARSEYFTNLNSPGRTRMILWTASSTRGSPAGPSGIGVMYKRSPTRWVDLSFHITTSTQPWVAEIAAISKAFQIAREETSKSQTKPDVVVVYSDSHRALVRLKREMIGTIPGHKKLLKPGLDTAQYLTGLGIEVELRWVPNRRQMETSARIQGNRLARSAAKKGARFEPSSQQTTTIFNTKQYTKKKIRAPVAFL